MRSRSNPCRNGANTGAIKGLLYESRSLLMVVDTIRICALDPNVKASLVALRQPEADSARDGG